MKHSISVDIAWQIAAWETASVSLEFIDKEMMLVGILSLEKVAAGKQDELGLDQNQWSQVKVESDALLEVFQHFKFNVTSTRRTLRQSKGTGNFRSNDNVVHRSEECKKIFNLAESLAGDNGILNVLILMAAIVADPGEKIGQILKDAEVEIVEFRNRLMDQASRVVVINADEPGIAENAQKSYLQKFGRDLTQDARDGKLYPFVGRKRN